MKAITKSEMNVEPSVRGTPWLAPEAWLPPLTMALLMTLLVRMCGLNVPYNDDFDSPGKMFFDWLQGSFGWHNLWEQHNESRLVIPRLIWLVEAFTVGWSTKHWMYASVLICALQAYLLALLLRQLVRHNFLRWLVAICVSLLLLHSQFAPGTFLRGSQGVILIPSLFIVFGLFLYSRQISFRSKLLIYVILAEISTLTFANGMIVWVLLYPIFPILHGLRDSSRDRGGILLSAALVLFCALAGIGSYFVNYGSTPPSWPVDGLAGFLRYFFSLIGAGAGSVGASRANFAFGLCLCVAAVACLTFVIMEAVKERTLARVEQTLPWTALVAYVLVSGVVNTFIRAPLGLTNAGAERYYLITIQLTVGLAGLLPILVCYRVDGTARRSQEARLASVGAILLGGILFALSGWPNGMARSQQYRRTIMRYRMALSLWAEAPMISPVPTAVALPRRRTHYLAMVEAGLIPDYSGGLWLTKALQEAQSREPVGQVHLKGQGVKLRAVGWAIHPITAMPFPAVLTVLQGPKSQLTPISVDLMNQKGPPLPGRLDTNESAFFMGFSTYPLSRSQKSGSADRLLFFAIDPATREAYPLRRNR